jgi:hypothetical protein
MSEETLTVPPPPPTAAEPRPPRRRRAGLVAGAVVVVIAVVGALVFVATRDADRAQAQPLALSFAQGDSRSYEIHQTIDGTLSSDLLGGDQPIDLDLTQRVTWAVTDVDGHGVATIEVTVDDISGTVDGQPIPSASSDVPPIEIQVAPDGRVVSAGGLALGGAGQTQGFGFPGMSQITPLLPDDGHAVAPGDTWHTAFSQPFPYGDGTIRFSADSRYDRDETLDGRDAAVIVTDMKVPLDFTLDLADLLDALGGAEDLPAGATGLDLLGDASLTYGGQGTISQTSWVDLGAKELLKSSSTGDFDISVSFAGVPGFEGDLSFTGSFTQDLATV